MAGWVRRFRRAAVAAAVIGSLIGLLAPVASSDPERTITVMTRNLYLGTDLNPILGATDVPSLLTAVEAGWNTVQASDPVARLDAIAGEIAASHPMLVGLQEVSLWRTAFPPDGPATPATFVAYDFLQILLDALAARGLTYTPVAISTNFDAEIPAGYPPLLDVRLTDRDVIVARSGLPAAALKVSNPMHGIFATSFPIPTPAGTLSGIRGWTAVDAKVRGKSFRFVNTHLETEAVPPAQTGQAYELLAGPANTTMPVLMLGDFNSRADGSGTPAYGIIAGAGFADAFGVAHPAATGYTCCQAPDLRNAVSSLDERIDIVFTRGGFGVRDAHRTGENPGDRTAGGLWPSDHAGVVATVVVPG